MAGRKDMFGFNPTNDTMSRADRISAQTAKLSLQGNYTNKPGPPKPDYGGKHVTTAGHTFRATKVDGTTTLRAGPGNKQGQSRSHGYGQEAPNQGGFLRAHTDEGHHQRSRSPTPDPMQRLTISEPVCFYVDDRVDYDLTMDIITGAMIGQGSYGCVFRAKAPDGDLLAVKRISLSFSEYSGPDGDFDVKKREIDSVVSMSHENICRTFGVAKTNVEILIFMELVTGGCMASQLREFGAFSESITKKYSRMLLNAIDYIHKMNVIHRDIKAANCLVTPDAVLKLTDFGCSRFAVSTQQLMSYRGTNSHIAPEMYEQSYSFPVDIYAFGCTVFEMLHADLPHPAQVSRPKALADDLSPAAKNFVQFSMARNTQERATINCLKNHKFLRSRD